MYQAVLCCSPALCLHTANLILFPQLFRCFSHSSQLHRVPQTLMQGFCPLEGVLQPCDVADALPQCIWMEWNLAGLITELCKSAKVSLPFFDVTCI